MVKGNNKDIATKFLTFSACVATFNGILYLFLPADVWLKWLTPAVAGAGEEAAGTYRFMMSACVLGWANGKYHAVKAGEARSKEFCKTNLIPMALFAYASYSVGAWDTLVWVGFTAAYAYCGFM